MFLGGGYEIEAVLGYMLYGRLMCRDNPPSPDEILAGGDLSDTFLLRG